MPTTVTRQQSEDIIKKLNQPGLNLHQIINAWLVDATDHNIFFVDTILQSEDISEKIQKYFEAKISPTIQLTLSDTTSIEEKDEFEGKASGTCIDFCNSKGLLIPLRLCLKKADVLFSSLFANIDHFLDEDVKDDTHVVIRVKTDSDLDTAFNKNIEWREWFIENIADEHRGYFVLIVE